MTEAEVLALINAAIVANGNNEITADVLRPILVAMLEQPNDKVGELVDLDTTDKSNIVNAINEILNTASTTFEIHSGANNPNTTPPASYSIGDWYIRSGSSIYQFNGDSWILLSSSSTISDTEHFLATEGQTVFTLSTTPVNVDVWVNDVYQELTYAYTFSGNTVTLNDPITAGDRVAIRKYEQNISGATQKTPIQGTYDDLAALIAAQGIQLTDYIYEVTDASGFTGIDSGKLWVRYLGTTLGTEADYSWEPRTTGGVVSSPTTVNLSSHGATPDAIAKSDGSITSGSAVLNSALGEFVVGDVGKVIFLGDGAGGGSLPLVTTILSYTSATQVTLATNALLTGTNIYYIYGTDNTTAIQNALDASFVIAMEYGKATVQCEAGTYLVNGAVGANGNGENSQIKWPYNNISDEAVNIELLGATQASIPRIHWQESGNNGTVIQSTRISQSFSALTGLPSVIGGPSSYGVQHGGGWAGFNYVGMTIRDITIRQCDNPWLTGIDAGWFHNMLIERVQMDTIITGLAATVPTRPTSLGIQFPVVNTRGPVIANAITVKGYYCAFGLGELLNGSRLEAILCTMLMSVTPAFHANNIDFLEDINCIHGFGGLNPAAGIIDPPTTFSWLPHVTNLGAGLFISLWSIQDNNGQVSGFNRIDHIKDGHSSTKIVGYFTIVEANNTRVDTGLILNGEVNHYLEDLFLKSFDTTLTPPIFLNVSDFEILSGSVAKSTQYGIPVWLFDSLSVESISSVIELPSDWNYYNITLYWTNNGIGAGDVVWRHDYKSINNGESFSAPSSIGNVVIDTAPIDGTLKKTVLEKGVARNKTLQVIQLLRLADNISDTLSNDAAFIGAFLEGSNLYIPIGLISYWKFNFNSFDNIGTNNGTDTSISYVSSGGIGNVADFTASTSSKISIADSINISFGDGVSDSPFTFSLRVKFASVASTMTILDKRLSDNSNKEYTLFNEPGFTRMVFRMFDQSTGGTRDIIHSGTFTVGVWYHIAITYTGITGSIFVNAVETSGVTDTGSYTAMENGTAPLLLGKDARNTTSSLNGYLDEISLFNIALTSDNVQFIYDKNQSGLALTD